MSKAKFKKGDIVYFTKYAKGHDWAMTHGTMSDNFVVLKNVRITSGDKRWNVIIGTISGKVETFAVDYMRDAPAGWHAGYLEPVEPFLAASIKAIYGRL